MGTQFAPVALHLLRAASRVYVWRCPANISADIGTTHYIQPGLYLLWHTYMGWIVCLSNWSHFQHGSHCCGITTYEHAVATSPVYCIAVLLYLVSIGYKANTVTYMHKQRGVRNYSCTPAMLKGDEFEWDDFNEKWEYWTWQFWPWLSGPALRSEICITEHGRGV